MQDNLEDNQEDYCSLDHEDWWYLQSKVDSRDNRKREENQIKKLSTLKEASIYDSNKSVRIPHKKRDRTGVCFKQKGKKITKQHSAQRYCVLCKKAGITERNYMSHNSEDCFGKCSDQDSIKDVLGGPTVIRDKAVKQYKRPEHKWKK